MTSLPPLSPEMADLLESLCLEELSPADAARLEDLVCSDVQCCRQYILFMEMHALVERFGDEGRGAWDEGRGMAGLPAIDVSVDLEHQIPEPRTPNPEPPFPPLSTTNYPLPAAPFVGSWAFSYMVATVIVCVMLLGFWAYKITHHQHIAEAPSQSVPSDDRPEMVFVGRITGMVDVKWSDDPRYLPPPDFAHVSLGRKYKLDSGLMEITYDSGAKVILQGPCTYEVESTAGGYLALGKLTARVETVEGKGSRFKVQGSRSKAEPSSFILHPSSLFSIRTPTAVVTDLGTEFGVEVSKEGATTSRVFRGSVRVKVVGDGLPSPSGRGAGGEGSVREVILGENESARVERAEGAGQMLILRLAAGKAPSGFVRAMPRPKPAVTVQIVETFDDAELGDAFEQNPPGRYAIRHGAAEHPRQEPFTPLDRDMRGYIRTVATDFNDRDFVFEATFHVRLDGPAHVPGTSAPHHIFFGLGDGVPNVKFYDNVTCGLVLSFVVDNGQALVRRYDPDSDSKRVVFGDTSDVGGTVTELAPPGSLSPGRHRFRLTKTGRCVKFAVDADFKGEFQQDFISRPIDLPTAMPLLDATNSRLLVGTGNCDVMTVRFEELSVTYLKTP